MRRSHTQPLAIFCFSNDQTDTVIVEFEVYLPDSEAVPPNNLPRGQPHTPPYAKQACFCGVVIYCQSYFVAIAELSKAGMSMAAGCSGPDSKRVTVQLGFSDNLPATTGPENLQEIWVLVRACG